MSKKLKMGIVGLRFGGEFPAIYRDHPDVEQVVICDLDKHLLRDYGNKFGFEERCDNYDGLLSRDLDAVHIVTNIHTHADLTVKALERGLHCACTVPMATTFDELEAIVKAQKNSGKNYMMMETAVYTYQCLYVKQLMDEGKIGRIQHMRGTHFQDMEGWPDYWKGLPPMHYATHAISPLLYLSGARAVKVCGYGSGRMRKELRTKYGNPYPVETAMIRLDNDELIVEATRSLFETAREYVEGFTLLGEKMSFEWNMEDENPYVFEFTDSMAETNLGLRGRGIDTRQVCCPNYQDRLPEPIRKYTVEHTILDPDNPHFSIKQGGGHHGSHPHLVHEFIRSIVDEREPIINAKFAANWTATGIGAHISAMAGGKEIEIPEFD